ncbi:hypothetical protein J5N97_006191 [Dioscorea zingiberensis]|uniref:Protein DA1-like domain-containing protein n=1 Tax=Dioscorea zingiberensis TaxID=325984 RepID=A0A9D5DBS8_9LILI|nr:hypothetical protein J5N97_006191 [Dioscorea zingiberensis]
MPLLLVSPFPFSNSLPSEALSQTLAPQRNARRSCVFARWLQKFCGRSTQCSSSSIRLPPRMDGDKKISGNETVISVDDQNKAAADDEEELNRAIALSLAENAKRPKGFKDHGDDSDEDLARAIQESLNMTSKSHPNNPVQVLPRGHRLLTGAILAHELMHAWFRLKGGYRDLSPKVEEGICQVLSQMWLESEVSHAGSRSIPAADFASSSSSSSKKATGKSDTEKELGKFFMHQIANDVSVAYGEGFRAANEAVNKYGLRQTLDHIHSTGHLPVKWAPNVELLQQNFTPCQTKYCGLAVPCAISMSFQ